MPFLKNGRFMPLPNDERNIIHDRGHNYSAGRNDKDLVGGT
jgi:hypothetical protein